MSTDRNNQSKIKYSIYYTSNKQNLFQAQPILSYIYAFFETMYNNTFHGLEFCELKNNHDLDMYY